jgi:hypothetical protein
MKAAHRLAGPSLLTWGLIGLGLLATHCVSKPPQYMEPDTVRSLDAGQNSSTPTGPMGGTGGPRDAASSSTEQDRPAGQICGTICEAQQSDGCCPVGCNGSSDIDCPSQCGNGVIEKGEQCDPRTSCPAACPNRGCTRFTLQGSADQCSALCVEAGLESVCKPDDGCCPPGCTVADDSDCSIMCGNGAKEGSETCDPLSSCPTVCLPQGCQLRKLVNPGSCTAECVNERLQTTCQADDSCCPPGCHSGNDSDCQAACDNGVKESGETCDPLSSCPADCPANQCQLRKLISPGNCKAQCVDDRLQTSCQGGDDCCPAGCNSANDSDCGIVCGNAIREAGETCDPPSSCPQSCPPTGCQLRELRNAGTCKATCENTRTQTACTGGDDCCPGACHNNNDSDCEPRCGNGVVERNEACDPPAECTRRQSACKSDRDNVRTAQGNANQCTFNCIESQRRCGDPDGQCPAHCNGNDPDCRRANGAECSAASQCLSNRCDDGRCCAETCSECEACTGANGTCRPARENQSCGNPSATCSGRINDKADTCRGGTCEPNVTTCPNGQVCRGSSCVPACNPADCGACRDCGADGCINGPERSGECGGLGCENGKCITCGKLNIPCCPDDTCDFSPDGRKLACLRNSRESICVDTTQCGNLNQRICQVIPCKFPLVQSFRNLCVESCGRMGEECCAQSPNCEAPFSCSDASTCTDLLFPLPRGN